MNARVIVTLKPTVLDPQGLTIHRSLHSLGFSGVDDIRQGKYFEIRLGEGLSDTDREAVVDRLAREVLTNPVVESYRVEWT